MGKGILRTVQEMICLEYKYFIGQEGFDSGSRAEFTRFLAYAQRSCSELQSEIYVALDQEYITKEEFDEMYSLANKARSRIGAFIKYLKRGTKTKNEERRTKNQERGTKNQERGTKNQERGTKNNA